MLNDQEPRNGRAARQYPETDISIIMTVYTRAPEKWLLVDRETGEVYQGNCLGSWDRMVQDPAITDDERVRNVKRVRPQ
jgi:hypothetical protein